MRRTCIEIKHETKREKEEVNNLGLDDRYKLSLDVCEVFAQLAHAQVLVLRARPHQIRLRGWHALTALKSQQRPRFLFPLQFS